MINKTHEAQFEFCDPLRMKIGGNDDSRYEKISKGKISIYI